MHFINFDIHTDLVPNKVYDLGYVDMTVYPTMRKLPETKVYQPRTLTGVIVKGEKQALTTDAIRSRVKDFVVFSNFIFPSHHSVRWLTSHHFHDLEKLARPIGELDRFLSENLETDLEQIHGFYKSHDIYGETTLFPHQNVNEVKVNFQELLAIYSSLGKNDILRQQISLFALNGNAITLLNRFYDNSNLEISLMYSIVDSLMKENDQPVIKKCVNCGHETTGKKKDKHRIKDFVSKLGYNASDQDLIFRTLWEHYRVRNDFFHETKIVPLGDTIKEIVDQTGSNLISLEDELKYGQGRLSGFMIVKELVQNLLIKKLKNSSQ